jgi:long-chain acyl-CoA synthetase
VEGRENVASVTNTGRPEGVADTFPKLLRVNAALRPQRPAIRHKDRGIWQTWNWAEADANIRALAYSLRGLGLQRGDKIAIIGGNRPLLYWTITAAQVLGAIPVPVYADSVAEELAYVLDNADATFAAAQDQEQVDKLLAIKNRLPALQHIIYDEDRGLADYDRSELHSIGALVAQGTKAFADKATANAAIEAEIDKGCGSDASIMLYTSGTTGRSKGVVLAAGRCIAAAKDTVAFDRLDDHDEELAYLPIAWAGDHYMNYAQAFVAGFCMACPESAETVQQDLREIGPTFYFAPPRVFEQMLTRILIRMEDAGFLKRALFNHFIAVAKKWGEKILNRADVPLHARLHYALGALLIYEPLKNILGFSRVRVAYTAGEAIGADLFSFYRSLGLNLKQLYGQTEAFLYVTCHGDGAIRAETVGAPAPGVEVRISPEGEVQFKSPGQFVAYYKDEAKTTETLTEDGFVKTGDAGFFEHDGQLKIIDRAKDVGRLKNGALFAPKYIENKLKFFPNIKEAVAFGGGCDFVTVMINIDMASVGSWAERNNVAYASYQELAGLPRVYDMVEQHVDEVNKALVREPIMAGAQIKRFLILHKELDPDDGELTRTQKVRRGFFAERYAPLVSALYDGAGEADIKTDVTFEDGRKSMIAARLKIRDLKSYRPPAAPMAEKRPVAEHTA